MDAAGYYIYVEDQDYVLKGRKGNVLLTDLNILKGCFGGGCGICKIDIVKGEYHIIKKMSRAHIQPEEERAGIVLSCCVVADSDLTIRLTAKQMEKRSDGIWD